MNSEPSRRKAAEEPSPVPPGRRKEGVESSQGEDRREASPEGDDWVVVEKPTPACDNGLVCTSAGGEGVMGEQEGGVSDSSSQGGMSDSMEGEVGGSDSTEGAAPVSDSSEDAGAEAAAGSSDIMEQGEGVDSEAGQDKSDTCSSSDQGERMSVGMGEEKTNSEAEPWEETASPVSVQSSEEKNEMDR
jgi:hypothetical protein